MARTVIALWGVSNVGKSQTVKKAYEILISKNPDAKQEYLKVGVDIKIVLTIGKCKIGIESQGDPNSRLEKTLKLFVKVGCKVIVCATRTRGQTIDVVNRLQPSYEVIWFQQPARSSAADRELSNAAMAAKLVAKVEEVIGAYNLDNVE